jgi:hypothetical protein
MDQYGYIVFRYVLFCGEAVPCRAVRPRAGACLDVTDEAVDPWTLYSNCRSPFPLRQA